MMIEEIFDSRVGVLILFVLAFLVILFLIVILISAITDGGDGCKEIAVELIKSNSDLGKALNFLKEVGCD